MAVSKIVTATSLGIEVEKGTDKAGDPIYTKKTFSNLRNDVDSQNAYDVADAIKGVLDPSSRNVSLTVASDLIKA